MLLDTDKGWLIDVDAVTGGNVLGSRPGPGGEWDAVRAIPKRTRARLVGAGMMSRHGLAPDQLAEVLNDALGTEMHYCDAVAWYVRHCLLQLDQRQREAARARRARRERDYAAEQLQRRRQARARKVTAGSTYSVGGWPRG